jgi:hypothetical protein
MPFFIRLTTKLLLTVRRKTIGTFASVCSEEVAIFKRLEKVPKRWKFLGFFHPSLLALMGKACQ